MAAIVNFLCLPPDLEPASREMTLHYASTFAVALGKLAPQEQKQVKITTVDLMMDPKGSGLSLERINRTADDKMWSARVSRDLRIIMRREGDDVLLAYVGHHNDAYAWAERRKIIPHERTGAMQIVHLVERQEVTSPSLAVQAAEASPPKSDSVQPFWALTDDQLLDIGVPRDWLQPVRETGENELDQLFDRLPAEAAEALLDFATGGKLEDHLAPQAGPGADPFAHPDAQRRFRQVEGVEELKAALDAPFEKWAVFLHPAQRSAVDREWNGPARVSGSAGTGKTIVALHRAVRLAQDDTAHVLLTTFSDRLAQNLAARAALLTAAQPNLASRISIEAIDDAAKRLYTAAFDKPDIADEGDIRRAIDAALDAGFGTSHAADFLFEEWNEVIDAWGVRDLDSYATVPRIGRKIRLAVANRVTAWEVFTFVRDRLVEQGKVTMADIYASLTSAVAEGDRLPFTHLVIDEAQDLSVAQARFIAAAGAGRPDALFFAGDLGQRIFHLPFSWSRLGIEIRGRSQVLKVCFRTSHQIRAMADRLLAPEIADQDGYVEGRRGTVSVFDGPEPEVRLFAEQDDEISAVAAWLRDCLANGVKPAELAVIVRGEGQSDRARRAIEATDGAVQLLAMHDAKGMEFRGCAVMAVDEDVLPDPARLEGVGDLADLEAIQDAERHLLYVACTRARDRLHVSGIDPGSEFLDDLGNARLE